MNSQQIKPDISIKSVTMGGIPYRIVAADVLCPNGACGIYCHATGPIITGAYAALVCSRCGFVVLIETTEDFVEGKGSYTIKDSYPKKTATVDPSVPKEMAADYLEAYRCFSVAAWHGCAVMVRRCIHQVVEHFKAQPGGSLYSQIEDLKNRHLIFPVLAELAQQVRVLGNHGAHPYDTKGNLLTELEMEDARSALDFCDAIFDQLFVTPAKIAASKQRVK
jgi:hypothetical protein